MTGAARLLARGGGTRAADDIGTRRNSHAPGGKHMHPCCVVTHMRGVLTRRDGLRETRVENEAVKAIRFASLHGEWPLDMSPAAGRALVRRPDSDELQRRWGDLVEAVIEE